MKNALDGQIRGVEHLLKRRECRGGDRPLLEDVLGTLRRLNHLRALLVAGHGEDEEDEVAAALLLECLGSPEQELAPPRSSS